MSVQKPLLIYDGDCSFCRYCIDYAQALTGTCVDYQPYQAVTQAFPTISAETFRAAIQLVDGEHHHSGADAAFRTLALGGRPAWHWCYRRLPGFALLCEWLYRWVAGHRRGVHWACKLSWGHVWQPLSYHRVSWLFLRGLGFIYLSAFISLAVQIQGLIGSDGILPLQYFLQGVEQHFGLEQYLGLERFYHLPTVFWLSSSDVMIGLVPWLGAICSLLVVFNRLPRLGLWGCYVLYLSLVHAGQVFMRFQWDILLLEVGVLAIVLSHWRIMGVWLFRWLLFRFMFMSGAVKLLSGDSAWADFSALTYHFETQPLPTSVAWYAHQLPEGLLQLMALVTFVIELGLALFIFFPRYFRYVAAAGFIVLQVAIMLTGNYTFFNLLTLLLCLFLLDDNGIEKFKWIKWSDCKPETTRSKDAGGKSTVAKRATHLVLTVLCVLLMTVSSLHLSAVLRQQYPSPFWLQLVRLTQPFYLSNSYGLFAVMTRTRPEIIIEGSMDGVTWREYQFTSKSGPLDRRPGWVIPHQPRLDWQLWFAALKQQAEDRWFERLMLALLHGEQSVVSLLAENPFPQAPPLYIRARLFDYQFTDRVTRQETGHWWQREYRHDYFPPIRLESYEP